MTVLRADGELTAFWNSGFGAESYHVTYTSDNGKNWSAAASDHPVGNGTTEITIKSLENSKTYTVGVRARNKNGYSGWRNSSPSGPYVAIVAPPRPKNVKGYPSDSAVTFIWDKPVDLGDAEVTGYQAAYWLNPGACTSPETVQWYNIYGSNGDMVYYTMPGLTNGTKYGVALRAVNQGTPGPGVRACLTPIAGVNPPPFVPPAPESVNVIRGDGKITVTWHPSWSATGYQVNYSTDGGNTWKMAAWWNATTSIILNGTDNATTYTVKVRGRNNRGDGPWSDSVTDPLPPSLSVTNIGATSATLTIAGHTGQWYYQQLHLTSEGYWNYNCDGNAVNSNSVNLTQLTASTQYAYYAHSESDCSDIPFVMTSFKTKASSGSSFSFNNVTQTTMDATLHEHNGSLWFKVTDDDRNQDVGDVQEWLVQHELLGHALQHHVHVHRLQRLRLRHAGGNRHRRHAARREANVC